MSTQNFLQAQPFSLAGAGVSIGDATIVLQTMLDINGSTISISDIGSLGFATIEPGNGTQEEAITFTGITQNGNGTATLTGVKSQLFKTPYTQSVGLSKSHAGGTLLILTNTAGFYNQLASLVDDETVIGTWTFTNPNYPRMDTSIPLPIDAEELVTKAYVDNRHGYWEAPVATAAALPAGVNTGEVRVVLDTMRIYLWTGAAWTAFTAAAVVSTPAYIMGSASVGSDHRTFTAGTSWSSVANVFVFRNGTLMVQNAAADYVTSTGNHIVFNYDVLDSDLITVLVLN